MNSGRRFCILVAGTALLPALAQADPFQNGSFENGLNPPTGWYRSLYAGEANATDITGWVITAGRIDWSGAPWNPKDGQFSAQLVDNATAISQTFDTVAGQSYNVSFSLQPWQTLSFSTDVTLGGSTYEAVILNGAYGTWYDFSTTLTATSSSSTLTFTSVSGGHEGPFLDDVRVMAVPEPKAILSWVGALGLVLMTLESRSRKELSPQLSKPTQIAGHSTSSRRR